MDIQPKIHPASYKDPDGFIFIKNGILYRQINISYIPTYQKLYSSGLYQNLTKNHYLIPHTETKNVKPLTPDGKIVIMPSSIPFISYPFEWSFSQLKDAAILTLKIQLTALQYGFSLKDASAYNIQFLHGSPIFIDTLSFEKLDLHKPWVAYRQFCQHFLGPLVLASYTDVRLLELLWTNLDGIPIDLISKLLPKRTYFNPLLLTHLHLHAFNQKKYSKPGSREIVHKKVSISKQSLTGLLDSLLSVTESLKWKYPNTRWSDYDELTSYSGSSFHHKTLIIEQLLSKFKNNIVWDIGANKGIFSRIASRYSSLVISSDIDPVAVENNYLEAKRLGNTNILPLIVDITNPSPALGWNNNEKKSFLSRTPVDLVIALALIHHLVITYNLPLSLIAQTFHLFGSYLIIEFVPKSDPQTQSLLTIRKDIFTNYTEKNFVTAFSKYYKIIKSIPLADSPRTIYLMQAK